MTAETAELENTAIEAALTGGQYLREVFRSGATDATHLDHDVKSSADTGAESEVLDVIESRFPEHALYAEESGVSGGNETYQWIVDPLDGTNNFEAGLPTFATAVTVLVDEEPTVGVVYAPVMDDLYVGTAGNGVRYNGRPVANDSVQSPAKSSVISVIGHDVKENPAHYEVAERINRDIERNCKRRIESWSPALHWGLLARGGLDGVVCYRPDREEQRLGELFAAESGLGVETGDHWYVAAGTDDLARCLTHVAETNT